MTKRRKTLHKRRRNGKHPPDLTVEELLSVVKDLLIGEGVNFTLEKGDIKRKHLVTTKSGVREAKRFLQRNRLLESWTPDASGGGMLVSDEVRGGYSLLIRSQVAKISASRYIEKGEKLFQMYGSGDAYSGISIWLGIAGSKSEAQRWASKAPKDEIGLTLVALHSMGEMLGPYWHWRHINWGRDHEVVKPYWVSKRYMEDHDAESAEIRAKFRSAND